MECLGLFSNQVHGIWLIGLPRISAQTYEGLARRFLMLSWLYNCWHVMIGKRIQNGQNWVRKVDLELRSQISVWVAIWATWDLRMFVWPLFIPFMSRLCFPRWLREKLSEPKFIGWDRFLYLHFWIPEMCGSGLAKIWWRMRQKLFELIKWLLRY